VMGLYNGVIGPGAGFLRGISLAETLPKVVASLLKI
jgi:hypothetical protein